MLRNFTINFGRDEGQDKRRTFFEPIKQLLNEPPTDFSKLEYTLTVSDENVSKLQEYFANQGTNIGSPDNPTSKANEVDEDKEEAEEEEDEEDDTLSVVEEADDAERKETKETSEAASQFATLFKNTAYIDATKALLAFCFKHPKDVLKPWLKAENSNICGARNIGELNLFLQKVSLSCTNVANFNGLDHEQQSSIIQFLKYLHHYSEIIQASNILSTVTSNKRTLNTLIQLLQKHTPTVYKQVPPRMVNLASKRPSVSEAMESNSPPQVVSPRSSTVSPIVGEGSLSIPPELKTKEEKLRAASAQGSSSVSSQSSPQLSTPHETAVARPLNQQAVKTRLVQLQIERTGLPITSPEDGSLTFSARISLSGGDAAERKRTAESVAHLSDTPHVLPLAATASERAPTLMEKTFLTEWKTAIDKLPTALKERREFIVNFLGLSETEQADFKEAHLIEVKDDQTYTLGLHTIGEIIFKADPTTKTIQVNGNCVIPSGESTKRNQMMQAQIELFLSGLSVHADPNKIVTFSQPIEPKHAVKVLVTRLMSDTYKDHFKNIRLSEDMTRAIQTLNIAEARNLLARVNGEHREEPRP